MLKLSWKLGGSKWYPYWVIVLTSSSGTNYVPNEHVANYVPNEHVAHLQYHPR